MEAVHEGECTLHIVVSVVSFFLRVTRRGYGKRFCRTSGMSLVAGYQWKEVLARRAIEENENSSASNLNTSRCTLWLWMSVIFHH